MLHKVGIIIILICGAVILSTLSVGNDPFGARDFFAFWSGGRVFLEGGNPYDDSTLKATQTLNTWNSSLHSNYTQQFFNPSWTLPFFAIIGFLPFKIATTLWILVGLISATLTVKYLTEILKADIKLVLVGAILFIYAWYALMVGQLSIFILFLLIYGIFDCEKNGPTWKSAVGAAGIFLKPHLFIPLVVWGMLNLGKREYRILGAKCVAILLLFIGLSELFHPGITSLWINRVGMPTQWISSTPAAIIQLYFSENYAPPQWPLFLMPALGIISSIVIHFKNPNITLTTAFPVLLFFGVFFAPYAFPYDFILCLPVILILAINTTSKLSALSILMLSALSSVVAGLFSNELQLNVIFSLTCLVLLIFEPRKAISKEF